MLKRIAWIAVAALVGGLVRHGIWRASEGRQTAGIVRPAPAIAKGPSTPQGVFSGRCVAVFDGDTIEVLDPTQIQHRIRLAGIDAPEMAHPGMAAQPFGRQAKDALADLIFGCGVTVQIQDRDRYGREVGRVACSNRDVNLAMVRAGWAWAYRQYLPEPQRTPCLAAEEAARRERRGLWADPSPVPPWAWRKEAREAH